jgi:hypothetical protein
MKLGSWGNNYLPDPIGFFDGESRFYPLVEKFLYIDLQEVLDGDSIFSYQ